jgi:predicted phage terminase large subunit-like protein
MMTGDANDYSVCTTWRIIKADYYLVDVFRARLQYPDLRRMVASLAAKHGAGTILIENAGPGMALLQDLWRDPPQAMTRPIGRKPEGSKVDRMVAQSAKIEAGHVLLPKEADWLDTFLHELLAFPSGQHDDQVDSVSQFLKWASSQRQSVFDLTMIGMGGKVWGGIRSIRQTGVIESELRDFQRQHSSPARCHRRMVPAERPGSAEQIEQSQMVVRAI